MLQGLTSGGLFSLLDNNSLSQIMPVPFLQSKKEEQATLPHTPPMPYNYMNGGYNPQAGYHNTYQQYVPPGAYPPYYSAQPNGQIGTNPYQGPMPPGSQYATPGQLGSTQYTGSFQYGGYPYYPTQAYQYGYPGGTPGSNNNGTGDASLNNQNGTVPATGPVPPGLPGYPNMQPYAGYMNMPPPPGPPYAVPNGVNPQITNPPGPDSEINGQDVVQLDSERIQCLNIGTMAAYGLEVDSFDVCVECTWEECKNAIGGALHDAEASEMPDTSVLSYLGGKCKFSEYDSAVSTRNFSPKDPTDGSIYCVSTDIPSYDVANSFIENLY